MVKLIAIVLVGACMTIGLQFGEPGGAVGGVVGIVLTVLAVMVIRTRNASNTTTPSSQVHTATDIIPHFTDTVADELAKLGDLQARGILNQDEFERCKHDLLASQNVYAGSGKTTDTNVLGETTFQTGEGELDAGSAQSTTMSTSEALGCGLAYLATATVVLYALWQLMT